MKNTILRILADAKTDVEGKINALPNNAASGNLNNVLNWVYAVSGVVAVGVIIYGGIKYITSQGDPGKAKQASQIIAYALVGLAVVGLAAAITNFVIKSGVNA